MHKLLSCN